MNQLGHGRSDYVKFALKIKKEKVKSKLRHNYFA